MSELTANAIGVYLLETKQIHNDSTSVTFTGAYDNQHPKAVELKHGFNKDHGLTANKSFLGGVLKRKISGGSISAEGANAYAILLSIYVTCRLRGISIHKYMKQSLLHYIKTGKPMLLGTYSTFIAESCEHKMAA